MSIRILLAEDHELVREALKDTFRGTEIEVVGEAATCLAAVQLATERQVDVVLVDLKMPGGDGFGVLAQIKAVKQHLPVLIYTVHNHDRDIERGRAMGACGWLVKGVSKAFLLEAIRLASTGKSLWKKSNIRVAVSTSGCKEIVAQGLDGD